MFVDESNSEVMGDDLGILTYLFGNCWEPLYCDKCVAAFILLQRTLEWLIYYDYIIVIIIIIIIIFSVLISRSTTYYFMKPAATVVVINTAS